MPDPSTPAEKVEDARLRVQRYITEYEDAPSWGGPTMYPERPSIEDLKLLAATPQHPAPASAEVERVPDEAVQAFFDELNKHPGGYSNYGVRCAIQAAITALRSPAPAQDEALRMGFVIDDDILRYDDGSCRPASAAEKCLWSALAATPDAKGAALARDGGEG